MPSPQSSEEAAAESPVMTPEPPRDPEDGDKDKDQETERESRSPSAADVPSSPNVNDKSESKLDGNATDSEALVDDASKGGDDRITDDDPPLPQQATPDGPPLPSEPVPEPPDDGWDCRWEESYQAWYFVNRFTGASQWENPRVSQGATTTADGAVPATSVSSVPQPPVGETPAVGGYNPAIHGDYDPNAWYAQVYKQEEEQREADAVAAANIMKPTAGTDVAVAFNRFTGQFQTADMGPGRHSDEAKSRRQMNAFFDVDAAANAHEGRSLKAERQNQRLSKAELKAFKEKRRAKKEEKRRAWLMD
ncbi:hypothetical protein DCS_01333 [Drechmeria coniospora]|uniref:WW domain-containing protein n=1 Tax=Drechmeria coniospora TaxID=98403 RepID=A0A151GSX0_DRECN|nr:hypothetical protein DCS_01333 [Drechmeria coniospora]KYK60197.1 hypothetical protein DCS_01333 [Drechmeria coniospora]ODA80140.1 hypothetical protein RJ55_03098 [Drechmeria coniospora]